MALVFRFPSYHPYSYYNRAPRGHDFFHDLWKEIARSYEQEAGNSHQGPTKIASVPLSHYKPEEISLEVDNEKVILHGLHQFEREDGFEKSEFKRVFKLPQGIDPKTVKSRASQDGQALIIEGTKPEEEEADDGKFRAKLDVSGFKPEEIKIQLHGNELNITGKHISERDDFYLSRDHSRRIVLPKDVILSTVTSRLSKEGLLTIEASRDPALLPQERSVDITMETDEGFQQMGEEPKAETSVDADETAN
ncbi:uncharacterized protein LOC110047449 [Orbicella faveolata]|uniref:uncharacterized protein LOC110047449 n=1 Tax=Orbicella faveolata TaxID=48498 RepID=UPI0009E42CDD|nr:uncharacterized protein LOC110047449 [Orbicella faveolata]